MANDSEYIAETTSESVDKEYAIRRVPNYYNLPETNYPPLCYTAYEPRESNNLAQKVIDVGLFTQSTDLSTIRDDNNKLVSVIDSLLNMIQKLCSYPLVRDSNSSMSASWSKELSFFDKSAVEKSIEQKLGYIDRKYVYISKGVGTTITIQVLVNNESPIWLCELQKGFLKYPVEYGDLTETVDLFTAELIGNKSQVTKAKTPKKQGTHYIL